MFCKKCGSQIADGSTFCQNCGFATGGFNPRIEVLKGVFSSSKWNTFCILLSITFAFTVFEAIASIAGSDDTNFISIVFSFIPVAFLLITTVACFSLKKNIFAKNISLLRFYPTFLNVFMYIIAVLLLFVTIIFSNISDVAELSSNELVSILGINGMLDVAEMVYDILTVIFLIYLALVVIYIIALHKLNGFIKSVRNEIEYGNVAIKKTGFVSGFYKAYAIFSIVLVIFAIIGYFDTPVQNTVSFVVFIANYVVSILLYFYLSSIISAVSHQMRNCIPCSAGDAPVDFGANDASASAEAPTADEANNDFVDDNK